MKAVGLFSGGLDSALAIKLMQDQGIEVIALNFISPFCTCTGGGCSITELAKKLGVEVIMMKKGADYMRILRRPKFGYGKNMNPCIDCKIYILKKAKQYAKKIGAKFLFTGEVVGQRPMSQKTNTLMQIEKEAGLKNKLLRPLCAAHLPETEAEKKGWIDRNKLLNITGRGRTRQLDIAEEYKIKGFMCGGGGCRLTHEEYGRKIKDYFEHTKKTRMRDIILLNYGRHFRHRQNKIIVGRNYFENEKLLTLRGKGELVFEVLGHGSPVTLLQGKPNTGAVKIAAGLTARYSDAKSEKVPVNYGKETLDQKKIVSILTDAYIDNYRI
ncbi:hypothetical protein J4418_01960 [Candidatus Woesearchaeota archaeon]|nr:hypothetical protein [Candidatus Woesearchaeota archaeon]